MINKIKISAILLGLNLIAVDAHAEETSFDNLADQMLSQSIAGMQQKMNEEIRKELSDNIEQTLSYDIQDTLFTLASQTSRSANKNKDIQKSIDSLELRSEKAKKQTSES